MDESSDDLGNKPRLEQAETFKKLIGFKAKSKLDKILIDGIFGAMIDRKVDDGDVFRQLR